MSDINLEAVLLEALDDERKAEATYAAVIEKFGEVRPFINIIDAERRQHVLFDEDSESCIDIKPRAFEPFTHESSPLDIGWHRSTMTGRKSQYAPGRSVRAYDGLLRAGQG